MKTRIRTWKMTKLRMRRMMWKREGKDENEDVVVIGLFALSSLSPGTSPSSALSD